MKSVTFEKDDPKFWRIYVDGKKIGRVYFTHSQSKHLWFRMIDFYVFYDKGQKGKECFLDDLKKFAGVEGDWPNAKPTGWAHAKRVLINHFQEVK